jgi:hypothetical protein
VGSQILAWCQAIFKRAFGEFVTNYHALLVSCLTFLTDACAHPPQTPLIRQPNSCGEQLAPFGKSAVAWQRTPLKGFRGTASETGNLAPIQSVMVTLEVFSGAIGSPRPRYHVPSDAGGRFEVDSLLPDLYLLHLRRLGYRDVSDTIRIVGDSGVLIRATMAPQNMIVDCGYFRSGRESNDSSRYALLPRSRDTIVRPRRTNST